MRKSNLLFVLVWMGLLMIQVKTSDINDVKSGHLLNLKEKLDVGVHDEKIKKNRWFLCWVLKEAKINHKPILNHIVKLMFSYLAYFPVNAKYYPPEKKQLLKGVFSSDNQWFLGIYLDSNTMYLSDLASGNVIQTFPLRIPGFHPNYIDCAIAENMKYVMLADHDKIYLWKTGSGELITSLANDDGPLSCCFCFDDTRIVSGNYDGTVRVFEVEETQWRCKFVLNGHSDTVWKCVGMIHDPRIVAYSHDKKLRVWNTTTGVCEHVLAGHTESPSWGSPCVISRDNQLIGSVIHNGETKIWNINTGQCLKTIPTISSPTENVYRRMKICYLSAERLVWWHASGTEFEVGVWNVRSDTAEYILPVKAQFVTVSAGGKYLMILEAGKDESMRVYSFDTENLNEIK
jgi:hypothetical protein